ncbi:MAG TPA: hypothetical protein VGU67_13320 [Edaphobacter sp.]|nr:hypothetical protein [Edaphobacter sp.]
MKDFDELLDGVLREDATVQPRTGLDARVIARVRIDGRKHRSGFGSRNLLWACSIAMFVCVAMASSIWYVSDRGLPQPVKVASRVPAPILNAPAVETPKLVVARHNVRLSQGEGGQHLRLPPVGSANEKPEHAPEDEPRLETFPAVSQKGDVTGWFGTSDGEKLAAIARRASPETVAAYQQLRSAQKEPIDIAAIEIKPLQ